MVDNFWLPIDKRFSVKQVNEMRQLTAQIMYMEDDWPTTWPMPEYPEDYINRQIWEERLRTYISAGVTVKEMKKYIKKRSKEIDKIHG